MLIGLILPALFLAVPTALPPGAQKLLSERYPSHTLAPIAPQIQSWFEEYRFPFAPNLIRADFNNDGRDDWAVLLLHQKTLRTVALISSGENWKLIELSQDPPDPFTYLLLYAKGEKDFDFRTLKHFRHKANSLGLMYFRQSPLQFTWKRGGFTKTLSLSDEEVGNEKE